MEPTTVKGGFQMMKLKCLAVGIFLALSNLLADASTGEQEDTAGTDWSAVSGSVASPAAMEANGLFGDRLKAKRKRRQASSTPIPAPTTPSLDQNFGWWGDVVKFTAQNLDPVPYGNISFMFDRPVRAFDTSGGNPYATWANFEIPDDSRTFAAVIEAHGLPSDTSGTVPTFYMVPPGVGPFTNIRGVVWAPQTGKIWVAADGKIQEYDIFLHNPAGYHRDPITGLTKPYISRVTPGGTMLAVDGVLGVAQVSQVNVTNGAQAPYAATKDAVFTRNIRPVGVAVDPDGSACYVADGSTGKVVKIPSGAGSGSTIVDAWGGRTFSFADPCGIDVHAGGHEVIVASNDGYLYTAPRPE